MPHVQSATSETTVNTLSATVSFGNKVGFGHAVIGVIAWDYTFSGAITITDDKSNTYNITASQFLTNSGVYQLGVAGIYLGNITNFPQTLTAAVSPSAAYVKLMVSEYATVWPINNPLDTAFTFSPVSVTSGVTFQSPTIGTLYNNEDIWTAVIIRGGGTVTPIGTIPSNLNLTTRASNTTDFTGLAVDTSSLRPLSVYFAQFQANVTAPAIVTTCSLRPGATAQGLCMVRGQVLPRPPQILAKNISQVGLLSPRSVLTQTNITTGQVYIT